MPPFNATLMPKVTAGALSALHADMPSPWLASAVNRDYDSNMYLKSPLTSLGAGNAYSPGVQFGWSPTTNAFFQRRSGASPYPNGGNLMDTSSSIIHKDYVLGDSAPAPLSARGLASVRRGGPSSMGPSLLDGPLTPSMYLPASEQPHGLGGLNLNHVVTESESAHHHGETAGVNSSSAMSTDVQTPSSWASAGHPYRAPGAYGCLYTPGHWDNNKTPTATSATNGVHIKMSPSTSSWTGNQIQPDLATAGSYSSRGQVECKRGDKTPVGLGQEGEGGSALARALSMTKTNGCLRTTSHGLLAPHASLLSQQRPYSPRDSMPLTTPSRLNGSDDSILPPLRSGGLSWFLNDWSAPLHPFKQSASGGMGLGNNDASMTSSNTVVFTPGGTLRESSCMNIVVAPTTSTAAGALSSHHSSAVVMGKPPLSARAPRQPRNSMSKASSPYSGGTGGSSGFSTQEEKSSAEHSPIDMDQSPQQASAHPLRGLTNLPGLALHLPGPEAILKGGVRPMSPICSSNIRSDESYETEEARWVAVQRRDSRASAAFFYCVLSTKIFCRTTCPSRHPVRENIIFVKTAAEAVSQGYRACRRCKPDLQGGDPHEERQEALIAKVKERLYASVAASGKGKTIKGQGLKYIAEDLGVSHWHLHRCFKKRVGTTPEAWAKLQAKKIRSSLGRQGRFPGANGAGANTVPGQSPGSGLSASYPGSTSNYLTHHHHHNHHHLHHHNHQHGATPTTGSLTLSPTPMAPSPEIKPLELSSRMIKTDPMMVMTMMSGSAGSATDSGTHSSPSVPLTSSPLSISGGYSSHSSHNAPAFPFPCSSYGSTTSSSSFASSSATSSFGTTTSGGGSHDAFSPTCSSSAE